RQCIRRELFTRHPKSRANEWVMEIVRISDFERLKMVIIQKRLQATSFLLNELKAAKTRYSTPREKHYYACLALVATALVVGADIRTLAERTGFRKNFVSRVFARMRRASLWKGDQSERDEWVEW